MIRCIKEFVGEWDCNVNFWSFRLCLGVLDIGWLLVFCILGYFFIEGYCFLFCGEFF